MQEKLSLQVEEFSFGKVLENGDVEVSGFAINPGKVKDIFRIKDEEMDNTTATINGRVILTNHQNNTESAVGRVTFSETRINPKTGQRATYFEGFVDSEEENLIRKIKKGIIDAVSIGFAYDAICGICGKPLNECMHWFGDEGFEIITQNMRVHELSIVPVPADKNATIGTSFSEELFSQDLVNLKNNKKETKTMSNENFEEKFAELSDKFADTVESHKDEIATLKASHEEELQKTKDAYETKIADKVGELAESKQEFEALKTKFNDLTKSYDALSEEMDKINEAKLSELRNKVEELSEKVGAGLSKEEIAEFSESVLNKYEEMFNNIIEAQPVKVSQVVVGEDQYSKEDEEAFNQASPLEKLSMRLL